MNKLSEFEFDLYKLREKMEEIHKTGTWDSKIQEEVERLTEIGQSMEKEIFHNFYLKHPEYFKMEGSFYIYPEFFEEDIRRILPLRNREFLLFGGHGLTAFIRQEDHHLKVERISGFEGHIYDCSKVGEQEVIVVGEYGEIKVLEEDKGTWKYKELIYSGKESLYGVLSLSKDKFLLLGDEGLALLVERNDYTLKTLDIWKGSTQTWQTGIVRNKQECFLFGSQGKTLLLQIKDDHFYKSKEIYGFQKKIYSVKKINHGYLVLGGNGETRILYYDGSWKYGHEIEGFRELIYDGAFLDQENLLVVGAKKRCMHLYFHNGFWKYGESFQGFPTFISAIEKTGKDEFLLAGWSGRLARLNISLPRSNKEYIDRIKRETGAFF
ncbi:MAG: hypothetical protein Q4Q07_05605 [Tissierellia bacterium]|nr:hypothetical protein [Tissierellia bacterium]